MFGIRPWRAVNGSVLAGPSMGSSRVMAAAIHQPFHDVASLANSDTGPHAPAALPIAVLWTGSPRDNLCFAGFGRK